MELSVVSGIICLPPGQRPAVGYRNPILSLGYRRLHLLRYPWFPVCSRRATRRASARPDWC